jgi:hypothetical protein
MIYGADTGSGKVETTMADEQRGKTPDSGSRKDKAQAASPPFAGLMRPWQWLAFVVVIGAFILNETLFQQAEGAGWHIYTAEDGLAGNIVTTLAVAPNGTLWVGTEFSGVSRFDGQAWTTFTVDDGLASNQIRAMAAGSDGSVWADTDGGLSRFDGQTWTTYALNDGLTGGVRRTIAVDADGSVWINTDRGIFRFDGEAWTVYTAADGLADNDVFDIAVAPEGGLWAWTGHRVSHFDGEAWTTYAIDDRVAGRYTGSAMAVTPDGTLWIGTADCGFAHFDGQTWTTYAIGDGPAPYGDVSIAVASDGTMWVGSGGSTCHFDGQTWTTYALDSQAALRGYYPSVRALAVDAQDRVWIAGTFNGLAVVDVRAGMSGESLRTRTDRQDTLRIALGAAAWAILITICWSANRQLGLQRFWLQWTLASAASLAAMLVTLFSWFFEPIHMWELLPVILAFVGGATALWFTLRRHVPRAGWLIGGWYVSLLGSLIAANDVQRAIEDTMFYRSGVIHVICPAWQIVAGWIAAGAMVGVVVGTVQQLGLRWHIYRAGEWVLSNALGCAAGVAAGIGTYEVLPDPTSSDWRTIVVGGAIAGATYGAITGVALVRFLRHRSGEGSK